MDNKIIKLNRYTTLPFLLDMLTRRKLTLLNPEFWEDYNDRKTLRVYKEMSGSKSLYALCLSHKQETVHHWNAFANGTSGCCIEFSFNKLISMIEVESNIKHGEVKYVKVAALAEYSRDKYEKLPFLKRYPFKNENEYRIILTSMEEQYPAIDINLNIDSIRKITISNKLPKSTYTSVKKMLLRLEPGLKKINRSTLYDNPTWINHFS